MQGSKFRHIRSAVFFASPKPAESRNLKPIIQMNDVNDSNDQAVRSFADRLKASHEQKKPSAS
jgi:hypothetical protein